jgi:hypothetical protein
VEELIGQILAQYGLPALTFGLLGVIGAQALRERKREPVAADPCAGVHAEIVALRAFIDGLHDGTRSHVARLHEGTRAQIAVVGRDVVVIQAQMTGLGRSVDAIRNRKA